MPKTRVSVFFGAGAEICYGLPSGGKFALDVFRTSVEKDREAFRKQIRDIDVASYYASTWLPRGYQNKRLHVFGKAEFDGLIASSLEYRRDEILAYLEHFDQNVNTVLQSWPLTADEIKHMFKTATQKEFGSVRYGQAIRLNGKLAQDVKLFDTDYFSAFVEVLKFYPNCSDLKRAVRAILELLIGSYGQQLIYHLNEELFEEAPSLSVFDDLSGVFSLDYKNIGQTGLEIVLDGTPGDKRVNRDSPIEMVFANLGRSILEDIYSRTLDYQALIDSHYRYLFNPRAHWARFTRIAIFLNTVRRYITSVVKGDVAKLKSGPGYYHDLVSLNDCFQLVAVGTSNYNKHVEQILRSVDILADVPVYHLNGSVDEYYDPYSNVVYSEIDEAVKKPEHILVPFIFTQSGVKPLTAVSMSRRYVEMYDRFKESDLICVIGYGFNGDDGHINGLLRSLAEVDHKKLVIMHFGSDDIDQARRDYQAKLRLSSPDGLTVLPITSERTVDGKIWYSALESLVD